MKKIIILFAVLALSTSAFSGDIFDEIYARNERQVRLFLKNNDINKFRDQEGRSVLMALLENFDNDIIFTAISKTNDINETDRGGWTALMYACAFTDNIQIYRKLLEKGASISQYSTDEYNMNSLMIAIWRNRSLEVIRLLAKDRESVNWINRDHITPSMLAKKFYRDERIFDILNSAKDSD